MEGTRRRKGLRSDMEISGMIGILCLKGIQWWKELESLKVSFLWRGGQEMSQAMFRGLRVLFWWCQSNKLDYSVLWPPSMVVLWPSRAQSRDHALGPLLWSWTVKQSHTLWVHCICIFLTPKQMGLMKQGSHEGLISKPVRIKSWGQLAFCLVVSLSAPS